MTEDGQKERESEWAYETRTGHPAPRRGGVPLLSHLVVAVVVFLIAWFAFATVTGVPVGLGKGNSSPASPSPSGSSPFHLTLVEVMNAKWNSTTSLAAFYVLGSQGLLESSADITVPSKTQVQLTIVSYDMPTPGTPSQYASVTGTVGNSMYLINGTMAMMGGMPMMWGKDVNAVPVASIAHTFTVTSLGVNIPVIGMDTVVANIYFNQTGTYSWQCYAPCGTSGGWGDNMVTPGWMTGSITVT